MAEFVYVMENVSKAWAGGKKLFENVTLSFLPSAKIGVVGVNGSGKSTLLKIMCGQESDFQGEARAEAGAKVGYLPQEPELDESRSVMDNVLDGVSELRNLLTRFEEISTKFAEPMGDDEMAALIAEQAEVQEKIDAANGWDLIAKAEMAMDALGCPAGDLEIKNLSGGQKRRIALCKLLLEAPDLLLLDEPTNHLDALTVAWLENYLINYKGTVVLITHDRYFLDNITGWILELDRGQALPYEGNYSSWALQKQKRLLQESREDKTRQRALSKELEWINATPEARRTKSKARISAYEKLRDETKKEVMGAAQIVIPCNKRLGNLVVEASGLIKSFGDICLIDDLSFKLPAGGIVGVIGPNGAGKTTLLRLICGIDKPTSGEMRLGEGVEIGYVDQSRDSLDGKKSVWEEISDGRDVIKLANGEVPARAWTAAFNFKGSDQQKKISTLSGGERNRVHLAKVLTLGANLLLLDEPTNDLDMETLRALEEGLENYAGCAMVISHDRRFLDRLATHMLAFEGDGKVVWFEGNFEDYEKNRIKRFGDGAMEHNRIKYKRFTR